MLNAEDQPCLSVDEVNLLWQRFFEEMEDGEEVTHAELLHRCEQKQRSAIPPVPRLEELTALLDLETALRQNILMGFHRTWVDAFLTYLPGSSSTWFGSSSYWCRSPLHSKVGY